MVRDYVVGNLTHESQISDLAVKIFACGSIVVSSDASGLLCKLRSVSGAVGSIWADIWADINAKAI
jgi:hypothetical protein